MPDQALDALSAGRCLYAPISSCSGLPSSEGLRNDDDVSAVLVCGAHYGRLRKMAPRDLDRLERVLREAFRPQVGRSPELHGYEDDVA